MDSPVRCGTPDRGIPRGVPRQLDDILEYHLGRAYARVRRTLWPGPDNATQDTPPALLASGQTVLIVVHNDARNVLGQMTVTVP